MCQVCFDIVDKAVRQGVPEKAAMEWLWSSTPYPFGVPTPEQILELEAMTPPAEAAKGRREEA